MFQFFSSVPAIFLFNSTNQSNGEKIRNDSCSTYAKLRIENFQKNLKNPHKGKLFKKNKAFEESKSIVLSLYNSYMKNS